MRLFAILLSLAFVTQANAAMIVEYGADTSTGFVTLPDANAAEVTPANLIAGSGLVDASGGTWNFSGWDTASTSFAAAVAANDNWTWGFTVSDDVNIDLTTMDIRLDRSGTGPDDFEIQASVNAGTPITVLSHNFNDSDASLDFLGVSLASLGTLSLGDVVTFTLGAYNSEGTGGTFDMETINFGGGGTYGLIINGDVSAVIPEPSSVLMSLMAISAFGAVAMRRRLG
jgi:hypothetical protein